VNHVITGLEPTSLQYSGGYVYLTTFLEMVIWDARKPNFPTQVGHYWYRPDSGGFSCRLSVLGRHAYIAGDDGRLFIVDVSDPAEPALFKEIASSNAWLGVHAKGPHVYLAGSQAQDVSAVGIMEVVEACLY
jgi:hypothetical protein